MTVVALLAALAWPVAAWGGTSARDLLIVAGLLVVAALPRVRPRGHLPLWASLGTLIIWSSGVAARGGIVDLEQLRVPTLIVIATLAVLTVRTLTSDERSSLIYGFIAIGCIQAALALIQVAAGVALRAPALERGVGTLGYPNGLGVLLVVSGILTAGELRRRGGPLLATALLLQCAGVLATASRMAILIGAIVALVLAARRSTGAPRALFALGLCAGAAVVVWRTLTEPAQDRPFLWAEAVQRIVASPITGEGTPASAFIPTSPGARATTHAHNEVLQWGVEFGITGIALGALVVVLALRALSRAQRIDPMAALAALALLAAGLTDFTLRITALTVAVALLVALAVPRGAVARAPRGAVPRGASPSLAADKNAVPTLHERTAS